MFNFIKRAKAADLLPDSMTLFAVCDRHDLLKHIPKGGTGCEIGVFAGANARFLRDQLKPEKLYLIDTWHLAPWEEVLTGKTFSVGQPLLPVTIEALRDSLKRLDPSYGGGDPATAFETLYRNVKQDFAGDPAVEIVRKSSHDAAALFKDETFDFIYVDADHSFDAVYNDLVLYEPKLKRGGMFVGNDYLASRKPIHNHYGVIPAVTHFCKVYGYQIVALCYGEYADFIIAKDTSSEYIQSFLRSLLGSTTPVIGLPQSIIANYRNEYPEGRFVPFF
jgi:hypothetical protein